MLIWPANSWIFWLIIAAGFGFYLRFGLFSKSKRPASRGHLVVFGVLAAGAVVATMVFPMLAFTADFNRGRPQFRGPGTGAGFQGDAIDVTLLSSAIALGMVATILGAWALCFDQSRGRKRCPRCWYDMSGAPALTCPECGSTARSERRLLKTRRRWWGVVVAILLAAIAATSAVGPKLRQGTWPELLPDTVLLVFAPYCTSNSPLSQQIDSRFASESFALRGNQGWPQKRLARWAAARAIASQGDGIAHQRGLCLLTFDDGDFTPFRERVVELTSSAAPNVGANALWTLACRMPGAPETDAAVAKTLDGTDQLAIFIALSIVDTRMRDTDRPTPLSDAIIRLSQHPNHLVRDATLRYAFVASPNADRDAIFERALKDESPVVRNAAMELFPGGLPAARRAELIADDLTCTDASVQWSAAYSLAVSDLDDEALWSQLPAVIAASTVDATHMISMIARKPGEAHRLDTLLTIAATPALRARVIGWLPKMQGHSTLTLERMRAMSAAWRTEGDMANAEALDGVVRGIEERIKQEAGD